MVYSEEQVFKAREQLFAIEHQYHRLLTSLATGSLVLSIAFVKDIAPQPSWHGVLIATWIALFVSVLCSVLRAHFLLLFFTQRQALYEQNIDPSNLPRVIQSDPYYLKTKLFAQVFRLLQPASLLLGLLLLSVFAIRNV